ncbi:hypothetical protein CBR_g26374 [Chara braunii]|uniref:Uncharacterized protein n=1 Tax=Chara braunii TaxID=69332 RepID=A0A388L7R8_CHABU|nr:hypothetical protein CBR_g26374 [Chara braunii]|eukprot:GBG78346.1 hypothetical protein CBR_g26374 [Chara braunii]
MEHSTGVPRHPDVEIGDAGSCELEKAGRGNEFDNSRRIGGADCAAENQDGPSGLRIADSRVAAVDQGDTNVDRQNDKAQGGANRIASVKRPFIELPLDEGRGEDGHVDKKANLSCSGIEEPELIVPIPCQVGAGYLPCLQAVERGSDYVPEMGVRLKDMERASSTLQDFVSSYFMFHEMDPHRPEDVFRFLPVLAYVEAYMYKLDELNEEVVNGALTVRGSGMRCQPPCSTTSELSVHRKTSNGGERITMTSNGDSRQRCVDGYDPSESEHGADERVASFVCDDNLDPFKGLKDLLRERKLLTDRLVLELDSGTEFWKLERSLCKAVAEGRPILREDVLKALKFKSFDYRVLSLLLYGLRGVEVNSLHMDFLSVSELLVEIADDLVGLCLRPRRLTFFSCQI